MNIEAMEGYLGNLRMHRPLVDANLLQIEGQISTLIEKIQ
jgi:hypothetical protein